jgi:site-specific DNA recombinase
MAIRKRETDLVMVSELSRISRSIKDFSDIWQMMQDNGCGFQSLRENFDTTTAAGEMVLFTVANIAQFERRQVSERVSANFNSRAQRGLFNGGSIPFGYKRIEGKPGYLEIDEEATSTVRSAFKAYLSEGALSQTAQWLNANGFRMKIEREGGGNRSRKGYFTTGNLKAMLKNRFYVGIKVYHHKGEILEAPAVWPAIIDSDIFKKVNSLLGSNYRRNKDNMESRYPYLLTGAVFCKCCGDRLVGKSAHGKREKIGYYEHSLSTKKMAVNLRFKRNCQPYRVLAKVTEPIVWNEIEKLLQNKKFAEELLESANRAHKLNPGSKELARLNHTCLALESQIENLTERLAKLPKEISATPIYKQIEKFEELKLESEQRISDLSKSGSFRDIPSQIENLQAFLCAIYEVLKKNGEDSLKLKAKVIRLLVDKVLVTSEGLEIYFKVGQSYIDRFFESIKKSPRVESSGFDLLQNIGVVCSNTCLIGVTDGA